MAEPKQSTQPPAEAQQEIAQAAAKTAASGGTQAQVATAAQEAAREQGYEISDEQAKQIATALTGPVVEGLIAEFDKRGVFQEPPEPVQAPPATQAPPGPAEQHSQAAQPVAPAGAAQVADEPARKPSWAERHFG